LAIVHGSCTINLPSRKTAVSGDFLLRHYIRFIVKDRPGIIAQIAGALAEQEINIHAILQKPGHTKANLPFVVIVEPCPSSVLKRALEKIATLDYLLEPTLDLQILEPEIEV
jgi:homoserine dehydrogenase